jgi:hypothetical protein
MPKPNPTHENRPQRVANRRTLPAQPAPSGGTRTSVSCRRPGASAHLPAALLGMAPPCVAALFWRGRGRRLWKRYTASLNRLQFGALRPQ